MFQKPPHHTHRVTHGSAPEGLFFQSANSSGSQFVAIFFIITVMCWDDCEWRWECLFSCNCLFPTEISMSDPFIVLIITRLLFCLPAHRGGHHSAVRIVGIHHEAGVPHPSPGRPSGSCHPPAQEFKAVSP